MKQFKLKIHPPSYSDELLIFNSSDLPEVNIFDLLKIYHCDSSPTDSVLVQVNSLKHGDLPKDTISVESSLAQSFGLVVFRDVFVLKTEPEDEAIDLFEVSFKDQYISRSDMWRMKKHLLNKCVYIDQYVEYCGIRAQVSELWANSTRVRCGYINDGANLVLRSYTAEVYVFIQMSSEMWEYDAYGYLQFERAVSFLKALFTKWKQKKCCHELTLVLFSRTLYKTQDVGDFPEHLRDSLRRNYRNQLYMDFYKCVVQTERLEDCTTLITTLNQLFNRYVQVTKLPGCPEGRNSSSAEGNFLEAINLSMNVFEQHCIDRNFDRTGQIVVCITPGVGVFDVDRKLAILTKERMIDNGIGSDLICLGQQPLHAVPLFKFHQSNHSSKCGESMGRQSSQDFHIPHWINHSFYTFNPFPDKGTTNINYIPRIRCPGADIVRKKPTLGPMFGVKLAGTELPSLQHVDYNEFDKQVFKYQRPLVKRHDMNEPITPMHFNEPYKTSENVENRADDEEPTYRPPTRPMHIPIPRRLTTSYGTASSLGSHMVHRPPYNQDGSESCLVVGSAHTRNSHFKKDGLVGNSRALFNPFNPSHMYARLTANRRRWVHTYPRGPQGEALVLHHQHSKHARSRQISESTDLDISQPLSSLESMASKSVGFSAQLTLGMDETSMSSSLASSNRSSSSNDNIDVSLRRGVQLNKPISSYGFSWLWGIAGDVQWTSQTNTGLDWKSLKCPACLPITTDYAPSDVELQDNYIKQSYDVVPDDPGYDSPTEDKTSERGSCEIFLELINQRLCHGYQIIKQTRRKRNHNSTGSSFTVVSPNMSEGSYRSFLTGCSPLTELPTDSYMLSHGRQYHHLRLSKDQDKIEVKIFKPKHPFSTVTLPYTYMLWPKTRDRYQAAQIAFCHNKVQDYYWNHLDDYVCSLDDNGSLIAKNVQQRWQSDFVIIPSPLKRLNLIKSLRKLNNFNFDVFNDCGCERSHEVECAAMTDGFLRFLDHVNKIRRNTEQTSRKSWRSSNAYKWCQSSPTSQLISSNQTTPTPPSVPTCSTPTSGQSTPLRQDEPPTISEKLMRGVDAQPVPLHLKGIDVSPQTKSSGNSPVQKLTVNSELIDIVAVMKDKQCGVNFVPESAALPAYTFVSLEAIFWATSNVGGLMGLKDACMLFEAMCNAKLIIHASKDPQHPFMYGYIFYSINEEYINNLSEIDDPTSYQYGHSSSPPQKFHKRWFEVEVTSRSLIPKEPITSPESAFQSTPTHETPQKTTRQHKEHNIVKMVLTNQMLASRAEWTHVKYSSRCSVGMDSLVFYFQLQWLVATATCIHSMLQMWQRESTRCDLYLCPVPSDPFAFPSSGVTGPLRSPLFVPLNLTPLQSHPSFQEWNKREEDDIIMSMMKGIVTKFGFLQGTCKFSKKTNLGSRNYIHFSGQVFVQIPVHGKVVQRRSVSFHRRPPKLNNSPVRSEHEASVGFYWSTNHMQTKRWRIPSLEECSPELLQQDFVDFCQNKDDRLKIFFENFI